MVWHNLNGQECIGWTLPKEYFRKEPQAPKPLVTAASAQARIDAAEARADRLAKALERIETEYLLNHTSKWVRETARAALQQETQP